MKKFLVISILTLMISGLSFADDSSCPEGVHQPVIMEPIGTLR